MAVGQILQQGQKPGRSISAAGAPEDVDGIVGGQFPQRLGPLFIRPGEGEGLFGALLVNNCFQAGVVELLEPHVKFHLRNTGGRGEDANAKGVAHGCSRIASSMASRGQPMSATITFPVNSFASGFSNPTF